MLFTISLLSNCDEIPGKIVYYKGILPINRVQLKATSDTLHLLLNDTTYNSISSMNVFTQSDKEYISIFDEKSESINIFSIETGQIVKKIIPTKYIPDERLKKTSVYCLNFDSIFISNSSKRLYLIDSSGRIKNLIKYPSKDPNINAHFENYRPLIIQNATLYSGIKPNAFLLKKRYARQWRAIYTYDFRTKKTSTFGHLPSRYQMGNYSYSFFNYSFCMTEHGNLLISFAADSNIYELYKDSLTVAYYAKSRNQTEDIVFDKLDQIGNDLGRQQFANSDSYGPIYHDAYRKRYCRIFQKSIRNPNSHEKSRYQKSMILLDEQFNLIGEWSMPDWMSTSTIFFTKKGGIYSRVNRSDENALHFIRFEYDEIPIE